MSIKDRIVRALALRWLAGKVKVWRKDPGMVGKIWKALDGQKLMLGVLALFIVKTWDATHNGHAGDLVGAVLSVFGWLPQGIDFGQAVPSAVIVLGFFHRLYKDGKEKKAGATLAEVGTPTGAVKAAYAAGDLEPVQKANGVLAIKMEGKTVSAPTV